MQPSSYSLDEPIAALATPLAESALAVIRTSGSGSIDLLAAAFSDPDALRTAPNAVLLHGRIVAADRSTVDEVVLGIYRAPHGYTGEDAVEIYAHGSIPGIRRILARLFEAGFRQARPGEFTFRAFASGRMDLTRAEAVRETIEAHTEQSRVMALHRLSGELAGRIGGLKKRLASILAAIEVQLDYDEDDAAGDIPLDAAALGSVRDALLALAATAARGRLYRDGARVALAGRTNAGKSSLFNCLLREDRSIVSDVHGTTRDYIEEWLDVGGIPVSLFDTAGLRTPGDEVEAAGIERSERIIDNAAVVVYLVDGTAGLDTEDGRFLAGGFALGSRSPAVIPVWNKVDRPGVGPVPDGFIPLSAKTGEGIAPLLDRLGTVLAAGTAPVAGTTLAIASERQEELLRRAAASIDAALAAERAGEPLDLIAPDVREAVDALGELTGEVSTADMLDEIFSHFCVGK